VMYSNTNSISHPFTSSLLPSAQLTHRPTSHGIPSLFPAFRSRQSTAPGGGIGCLFPTRLQSRPGPGAAAAGPDQPGWCWIRSPDDHLAGRLPAVNKPEAWDATVERRGPAPSDGPSLAVTGARGAALRAPQ